MRPLVAIFALALALVSGCHDTKSQLVDSPPPVPDTNLGVGDVFEVRVYGEQDLSGTYRVGGEGNITFPLVGVIQVEGLDPQTAAKRIAERLADGILRSPQVSVLVKEQTSKKIVLIGQVAKPGTYPYTPAMTILEAITVAGGFTQIASRNDVSITRVDKGQKTTTKIQAAEIGEGRGKNVYVRPGDIISVPERIF